MKFNLSKSVAGAVFGAGLLFSGSAGAVDWKMATPWGGGVLLEEMKQFAAKIKDATEGRVATVFPAGTFGKALKVTEPVKSGVAQVGHNWMGYDWGIDKATVIFGGYVGGLNEEEFFLWLYEAGAKLWEEYRMERFGVVSMPCGIFPAEIFLHSKKKGYELRRIQRHQATHGGRMGGSWWVIRCNNGYSSGIGGVYPALERGVIDATEWSSPSINEPVASTKSLSTSFSQVFISLVQHRNVNLTKGGIAWKREIVKQFVRQPNLLFSELEKLRFFTKICSHIVVCKKVVTQCCA